MTLFGNVVALPPPPQADGAVRIRDPAVLGGSVHVRDPAEFQGVVPVPVPPELGGVVAVRDPAEFQGVVPVPVPPELGGVVAVRDPAEFQGVVPVPVPPELGGAVPVRDPAEFQGVVPVPVPPELEGVVAVRDPAEFQGVVPVRDPLELGGEVPIPVPPELGGAVPVRDPPELRGRVAILGGVQRNYDWVLALLVWIGTWGQEYYQNQTCVNTGETHAQWLARVKTNQAVAKHEFKLAWNNRNCPPRRIPPGDPEFAHIQAFVSILRDMCNTQRLKGIYPPVKGKDVDAPLWDVIVKHYVDSNYGPHALMGPHQPNQYPPLFV